MSDEEDGDETHLIPILDPREHDYTEECWCRPYEYSPGVWVHVHSKAKLPSTIH